MEMGGRCAAEYGIMDQKRAPDRRPRDSLTGAASAAHVIGCLNARARREAWIRKMPCLQPPPRAFRFPTTSNVHTSRPQSCDDRRQSDTSVLGVSARTGESEGVRRGNHLPCYNVQAAHPESVPLC